MTEAQAFEATIRDRMLCKVFGEQFITESDAMLGGALRTRRANGRKWRQSHQRVLDAIDYAIAETRRFNRSKK